MTGQSSGRVIHSFDTERHRVRCGTTEQTRSTKHASGVTCEACRALLGRAAPAAPVEGAAPEE